MTNTQLLSTLEKILPKVQTPGRYAGGEFNQIVKAWETIDIHIALLFPEIYDLGMSNLGLMILYDLINQQPKFSAERAFLPWTDMEDAMRANRFLYTLWKQNILCLPLIFWLYLCPTKAYIPTCLIPLTLPGYRSIHLTGQMITHWL